MRNGFAALVRAKSRAVAGTVRRKLDDYETPEAITQYLLHRVTFRGPILEPAAGSGRMCNILRRANRNATGCDIKSGHDFFKRTKIWPGDIVTNPPYRDGLAERFTRHALKLADGRVCMLMQSGFLWGDRRASGLYTESKPDKIILVPERIRFFIDDKPIASQFFNHAWLCWPDRKTRDRGGYQTVAYWASEL